MVLAVVGSYYAPDVRLDVRFPAALWGRTSTGSDPGLVDMSVELEQGREAYRGRAWEEAYRSLSVADRGSSLGVEDLECLATAAYLTGREPAFYRFIERAHHGHVEAGDMERAARSAFWLGLTLLFQGETGQANGWFGRARRLVDGRDCVEHGYLLLPVAEGQLRGGDADAAHDTAATAAGLAERLGDADLVACAQHVQGRALLQKRRIDAGLALLDEAMLPVVAGELSPMITGLVYCSVIEACQQVYALSRAREWTAALAGWCDRQPEMIAFTASCLVHRAEVMELQGDWPDAMAEARRACERSPPDEERDPPAAALYRIAELHRLRGEFAAADQAYREASRHGWEPQPGLALLRMRQGRLDAACAGLRRVLDAATEPLKRAKLLPAFVEVMLAANELPEARSAGGELEEIAREFGAEVMDAEAAHARGAVELAEGDARAAVAPLGRAFEGWRELNAPYQAARVRVLLGRACLALGDEEGGNMELEAARVVFERLGAKPELARLDTADPSRQPHGLTPRELEVLRLVAAGKTNKAVAAELSLSERTIDRHLSNIFTKLDVSSRAAATAYAYRHDLL